MAGVGRVIRSVWPRITTAGAAGSSLSVERSSQLLDAGQGRRRPTPPSRRALHSRTTASGRYFMHAAASLSIERSAIGAYMHVIGDALSV